MTENNALCTVEKIDAERLLALEQALIRIPSSAFKEHQIADYLAEYMRTLGLEVEMMTVEHPYEPEKPESRQPVGRLKGTGGGASLMLNAHMDPGVEMPGWSVDPHEAKFEDGWVWGMGVASGKLTRRAVPRVSAKTSNCGLVA